MKIGINTYYKHQLLVGFLLGFWLVVFLIIIGPFDAATLPTSSRFKFMYGYGLVFFASYMVIIPIQNWLHKRKKTWNLSLELIIIFIFCLITFYPTYLYYKTDIVNGDFGLHAFLEIIYLPMLVVLVPLILTGRWMIQKFKPQKGWFSKDFSNEDELELKYWKKEIDALIADGVFLNPNITQKEMASMLKTNNSLLSKVINRGYGQNFNDFINEKRIDFLLEKINNGQHKLHTLSGISSECGFNSKATFNRAFKKHLKMSPSEYIKNLNS